MYKQGGSISRLDFLLILAESQSSLGGVVQPATWGHPSKITNTLDTASQIRCHGHQRRSLPGCSLLGQWKEERVTVRKAYV